MKNHLSRSAIAGILSLALTVPACNTSRAVKGGAIGAGAGAGVGAVIGNQFDGKNSTVVGAIIGAAVGGTAGALIGRHMDKQAEELQRDLQGATVTRVGEGIKITFDSGLLFAVDKSDLNSTAVQNVNELGQTLLKYEDTDILIEGHTDNTGTEDHNQTLSENRAKSVSGYLIQRGVVFNRFTTVGYGENQPVADNATAAGRQENRRVEVAITANKKLKKAAKRGDIGT